MNGKENALMSYTPPSRTTEYRCMRHDMKQHCAVLLCLLEKQQYETAKEYLKKLIDDTEDASNEK